MSERIDTLKELIENSESCRATHVGSSVVREPYPGDKEFIWERVVETFQLHDHPKAIKRVYAWQGWSDVEKRETQYLVVLGVPPVNSPEDAVRVVIVGDYKKFLSEL